MKLIKKIGLLFALFSTCLLQHVYADDTISSGLTLSVPSQGSKNWGTSFKNNFATPISAHDHTGGGKGLQISTNALASNAVTDPKIRLTNAGWLRARNAANSADVNLLRLNSSNIFELASPLPFASGGLGVSSTPGNGQIPIGTGSGYNVATITGTSNQLIVTNSSGAIVLSLPQSIALASTPTFGGMTLTGALDLGTISHAGTISVQATGSNTILLGTNGTNRWSVDSDGRYNPQADDSYEIGSSVNTLKNVWIKRRTHTPSFSVSSGSVTTSSTDFFRYTRMGKLVFYNFSVNVTPSANTSSIYVTVPSSATSAQVSVGSCFSNPLSASSEVLTNYIAATDNKLSINRQSGNFFSLATSYNFICSGSYEEA